MLCDCFVFPKCLVNQFKNSVDDLTRIRVIANEYLLYKYLIFRGALIYGICTTVHEHTQLHEQWTTSLLKCTNYNQMFRQLNLCEMLDITLCSVESFLGHHPCNKSSSTHAVAGWCPPNFQHVCQMTSCELIRKHLPDDVSTWGIHFLLYGWCPGTLMLRTQCNVQHTAKIQLSICLHVFTRHII